MCAGGVVGWTTAGAQTDQVIVFSTGRETGAEVREPMLVTTGSCDLSVDILTFDFLSISCEHAIFPTGVI